MTRTLQSKGVSERSEDGGGLAILILAAGPSSRMGKSKQLLLVDGIPLLRKTTEVALQIKNAKVIVVLGSNASQHTEILKGLPVHVVVNEQWQNGIGSSLRAGMMHLQDKIPKSRAVLILVCDQPFLTSTHLKKLIDKYSSGNKIIASTYAHTLGVPCLFDQRYFSDLLNLNDEEGAKKLLQRFIDDVGTVEFPDGEIDLDTPEDYQKLMV